MSNDSDKWPAPRCTTPKCPSKGLPMGKSVAPGFWCCRGEQNRKGCWTIVEQVAPSVRVRYAR